MGNSINPTFTFLQAWPEYLSSWEQNFLQQLHLGWGCLTPTSLDKSQGQESTGPPSVSSVAACEVAAEHSSYMLTYSVQSILELPPLSLPCPKKN